MPNAALARSVLDRIIASPDQCDQSTWLDGGAPQLAHDQVPVCGTTLCVGGWAAHFAGYTLSQNGTGFFAVKDGIRVPVQRAALSALAITEDDGLQLFDEDLLPEQAKAALDQLADGAPHINWESANAAAYSLADGDFSRSAEHESHRAWGITHDLIIDGSRRSGTLGITPTAMRFIVAGWNDDRESGDAQTFWRDERGIWTTAAGHRYVPRLADATVIYPASMQGSEDARRITGARELTWVGPLGDRLRYVIAPADNRPELADSRHIRTHETPEPETVHSYLGTSWPLRDRDACRRCGGIGFLARATEWPGRPAFCIDCHDTLRTAQAASGHQCADACPQPVDHTGLCTT